MDENEFEQVSDAHTAAVAVTPLYRLLDAQGVLAVETSDESEVGRFVIAQIADGADYRIDVVNEYGERLVGDGDGGFKVEAPEVADAGLTVYVDEDDALEVKWDGVRTFRAYVDRKLDDTFVDEDALRGPVHARVIAYAWANNENG